MKKTVKFFAAVLTAVMAVSAISISAMAADENVVATFVNENNETVYVTEGDILAGNDTYTMFDGTVLTLSVNDVKESREISPFAIITDFFSGAAEPPYNSATRSIKNYEYGGTTTTPAGATRFSRNLLTNGSGSDVLMKVRPSGNISGAEYYVYRYNASGQPEYWFKLTPSTLEVSARGTGCPNNAKMYVLINNYNRSAASTANVSIVSSN